MKMILVLFCAFLPVAAQQPAPNLQISVNGGREVEVVKGWPLVVRGIIAHSDRRRATDSTPPLRLAPPGTTWTEKIAIRVFSASGEEVQWDLKLARVPADPGLVLPARSYATVEWLLSEEATAKLAEGDYRLAAFLEIEGGSGWNGKVRSVPVSIGVIPEPEVPVPEQIWERARLRAEAAVLDGNIEDGVARMDELLKVQPDNVEALQMQATLLERGGNLVAALLSAMQAKIEFFKQCPAPEEPPEALLMLVDRLWRSVLDSPE
ncbi:MAG: hypothetical protein M1541_10180 [Acidobacteria bacterium]|nr:hypothetical protein [Acidobacteriota bacterium]